MKRYDHSDLALDDFAACLNDFSRGRLIAKQQELERTRVQGDLKPRATLAWALWRLRDSGPAQSDEYLIALRMVYLARKLVDRWGNNPGAVAVCGCLAHEFPHAVGTLSAASFLEDVGNIVGFTDIRTASGRSSDLYLESEGRRVPVEIKAPGQLQWPAQPNPSDQGLENFVARKLERARCQIEGGGIVVLTSLAYQSDSRVRMERLVTKLRDGGKLPSPLAAVVGVCEEALQVSQLEANSYLLEQRGHIWLVQNPRYAGLPLNIETVPLSRSNP